MQRQSNKKFDLFDIRETAQQLGVKPACIRGWIFRGTLPHYKIGGCIRVSSEAIAEILKRGERPARQEA